MSRIRKQDFSLYSVASSLSNQMDYIKQVYSGAHCSAFRSKRGFERFVRYALKNDPFFCSLISRDTTTFFKRDEIQFLVAEFLDVYETYTLEEKTTN